NGQDADEVGSGDQAGGAGYRARQGPPSRAAPQGGAADDARAAALPRDPPALALARDEEPAPRWPSAGARPGSGRRCLVRSHRRSPRSSPSWAASGSTMRSTARVGGGSSSRSHSATISNRPTG